jgi:hypothetical protein
MTAIVAALGDLVQVIRDADPADKADLYAQLGLTLTYRPQKRLVEASVTPSLHVCKGFVSEGGLEPGNRCDLPGSGKSCNKSNTAGAGGPKYPDMRSLFSLLAGWNGWLSAVLALGVGTSLRGSEKPV